MLKGAKAYLIAVALAFPGTADRADAAGLGRLIISSVQGQPFKAEIDLVAVKKEEKALLTARLASQEAFRQASVDYLPVLSTFQATIETRANGSPYVRIVSPQTVSEPLLNILVELNWPSGRLLREYTVVLPHAEHDSNTTTAKQAGNSGSNHPVKAASTAEKSLAAARHDAKQPLETERPSSAATSSSSYGRVKEGDTLAGIAKTVAENMAGTGASMNQVLIALHRANPDAFIGDNIHQLKAGATLRIPDRAEIGAITLAEADRTVRLQTADWRQRRLDAMAEAPEEFRQTVTGTIDRTGDPAAASAREPAREVLRLSKGAEQRGQDQETATYAGANHTGNPGEMRSVQHPRTSEQLQAMEEDATARDRALREANERIALLEKNIRELQQLLELKNFALAEMQKRAEGIQVAGSLPGDAQMAQSRPEPIVESAAERAARQSSETSEVTGAEPAQITTDVSESGVSESPISERVELAKPARLARLPHETGLSTAETRTRGKGSFLDDLMANFEYLGGALVLLLTGIVGVSMVRGSKSSSVFEPDDKDSAGTPVLQPEKREPKTIMGPEANQAGRIDVSPPVTPPESSPKADPVGISPTVADAELEAAAKPAPKHVLKPALEPMLKPVPEPVPVEGHTERDLHWHEIVTKLDLARAYQEMGDKESARQILQEVIREGDQRQREHATAILNRL